MGDYELLSVVTNLQKLTEQQEKHKARRGAIAK